MKRILGFILIFSVLICSLSVGFVSSAEGEEGNIEFSLNFDQETVNAEDILEVTVCMNSSYESFLLGGIKFAIKYEYNGPSRSIIPMSFELLHDEMVYDERFSKDMHVGEPQKKGSYIVTTFSSEPEAVFEEDKISITFPFLAKETLYEGQYSFELEINDLYTIDLEGEDNVPSLNYTVESDDYFGWSGYPIWFGDHEFLILAGERTEGMPIYIDKEITFSDEIYIENENVAIFDDSRYEGGIQNEDDYAFVYTKGISLGETELYVIAEYKDFKVDEDGKPIEYSYTRIFAKKIHVSKPEPWYPSIESQPYKTDYFVGEEIDITGLQFRIGYNNNDVKVVSSGFRVMEYDFSTPGEKTVDVYYTDNFYNTVSLKVKFNVMCETDSAYLYNIAAKTTVERFLKFNYFTEDVKLYSGDIEVTDGILKTGMKVKLYADEEPVKEYTVAVNNDLNGNGRVDIGDLAALKRVTAKIDTLDEFDLKVLRKISAEEITAIDLLKMQKEVLGVR